MSNSVLSSRIQFVFLLNLRNHLTFARMRSQVKYFKSICNSFCSKRITEDDLQDSNKSKLDFTHLSLMRDNILAHIFKYFGLFCPFSEKLYARPYFLE